MPYQNTVSSGKSASLRTSEDESHPEFSQAYENLWAPKRCPEPDFDKCTADLDTIDPFAKRAVKNMTMASFLSAHPTHDGSDGPTSTDLNFSLRNFLVASPADDPNALYARVAVKEGRALPGYIPNLPQRTVTEGEASLEIEPRQSQLQFTTHPYLSRAHVDMWALKQGLERDYYDTLEAHAAETIDPFAEQAIEDIATARLQTHNVDSTLMDLDFSLRNFATVSPADDPNALFAKEGHAWLQSKEDFEGVKRQIWAQRKTYGNQQGTKLGSRWTYLQAIVCPSLGLFSENYYFLFEKTHNFSFSFFRLSLKPFLKDVAE